MNTKELGYVYILTNPSFREDWVKIGKSSRPVDMRSKEMDVNAMKKVTEIYHLTAEQESGRLPEYGRYHSQSSWQEDIAVG